MIFVFFLQLTEVSWWFLIVRMTEILDTVFPILRKSTSLINTNYVIMHHTLLPPCLWYMVKYVPGGHATFFCFSNSFVHIFVHVVHLLSSLKMKFHQPIKKYFIHISIVSRVECSNSAICSNSTILPYFHRN